MRVTTPIDGFVIRAATCADVPLLLTLIRELAVYEKLERDVTATEEQLRQHIFGERPAAEVLIGELGGEPVAFALFFGTFSTFLGRPGIYLEDLFVREAFRSRGLGRCLLTYLGYLARERGCGRLEWSVLDWNRPAIDFYRTLGAEPLDDWTMFRVTGGRLTALAAAAAVPAEPSSL